MSVEQFLNQQILELRDQRASLNARIAELENQVLETAKEAMKIQAQFEEAFKIAEHRGKMIREQAERVDSAESREQALRGVLKDCLRMWRSMVSSGESFTDSSSAYFKGAWDVAMQTARQETSAIEGHRGSVLCGNCGATVVRRPQQSQQASSNPEEHARNCIYDGKLWACVPACPVSQRTAQGVAKDD